MRPQKTIIVGGGPAGAALAITLARRGVRAVVLESRSAPDVKVGECIPPDTNPLLEKLGIKDRMTRNGHMLLYGKRSVWGSDAVIEQDFIFGVNGPGWQLNRLNFEKQLSDAARAEGIDFLFGHRLITCSLQDRRWRLKVNTPGGIREMEADFVVDASGRPARLARQMGSNQIRYDKLIAVVAEIRYAAQPSHFTTVEAVASGWWYSAHLPEGVMSILYLTDSDLIDHKTIRHIDCWQAELEKTVHIRNYLRESEGSFLKPLRIIPADSLRLDAVIGERWLAVGDAASAYDPLASYGISAALGAGFYGGHAVADFLAGNSSALDTYSAISDQSYARYLFMRWEHYRLEQRWAGEPFWQRRHKLPEVLKSGGQGRS
ncbi:MAG: FAD-dependent monooxygenase [Blastocatellia bacterium]